MKDLENIANKSNLEENSFGDFTRKSVVGAVYRVGASFTMDAVYLTVAGAFGYYLAENIEIAESITTSAYDFVKNLDPAKLARVTLFVVGINFIDYKFDITNRLDNLAKGLRKK